MGTDGEQALVDASMYKFCSGLDVGVSLSFVGMQRPTGSQYTH